MPLGEDMSPPAIIVGIQSSTQIQPLGNHDRHSFITTRADLDLVRGVAGGTMKRFWGLTLRLRLRLRLPPHLPRALPSLKPTPHTCFKPPLNNRIHMRRMQTTMSTDPNKWQPMDIEIRNERPILQPETQTRLSTGRSTHAYIHR